MKQRSKHMVCVRLTPDQAQALVNLAMECEEAGSNTRDVVLSVRAAQIISGTLSEWSAQWTREAMVEEARQEENERARR
jgi:hypothetical protein